MLKHDFTARLKEKIKKTFKKDKKRYEILIKKIKQIADSNEFSIEHYKNLKNELSDEKRAHIDKNFVLTFKYFKGKKFILFLDFDHHNNIYKK